LHAGRQREALDGKHGILRGRVDDQEYFCFLFFKV
jgi:hypothetical protein